MSKLQQDFEEWATSYHGAYNIGKVSIPVLVYSNHNVHHDWTMWQRVYNKYSQDNQKYIDLLKDIYYNYDLPNGVDQKIEKLLGDLL